MGLYKDEHYQEAEVIAELQRGNIAEFQKLYDKHSRRVLSLCLRMVRSREVAEDLTQETFLAVFRRICTFRGDAAFSTWLHRLAVNVVFMHLRQQKSRISEVPYLDPDQDDDCASAGHGEIDRVLASADSRIALIRALDQLPPGYRLVFVLHDIEGYEHREIAELLGCSAGNTKSQLHKARLKLRRLLMEKPDSANHARGRYRREDRRQKVSRVLPVWLRAGVSSRGQEEQLER